jgi:hypothetical protein
MKNKQKIALILVAVGVVFYIVNLVIYTPKFGAYLQAMETWNHTANQTMPGPAAYGLDTSAFIISPSLICAAYVLVLVGGGYLFAVLVAKVAHQLGYLKESDENTKQQKRRNQ